MGKKSLKNNKVIKSKSVSNKKNEPISQVKPPLIKSAQTPMPANCVSSSNMNILTPGTPASMLSKNYSQSTSQSSPSFSQSPMNKSLDMDNLSSEIQELPEGVYGLGSHEHDDFDFLKDRRDKNGNRPGDVGYNPRTLLISNSFIEKETPAMKQWWEFKRNNMDVILFFKVCFLFSSNNFSTNINYFFRLESFLSYLIWIQMLVLENLILFI